MTHELEVWLFSDRVGTLALVDGRLVAEQRLVVQRIVAPRAVGQEQQARAVVARTVESAHADQRVRAVVAGIDAGQRDQCFGEIAITVAAQLFFADDADRRRRLLGRLGKARGADDIDLEQIFKRQFREFRRTGGGRQHTGKRQGDG